MNSTQDLTPDDRELLAQEIKIIRAGHAAELIALDGQPGWHADDYSRMNPLTRRLGTPTGTQLLDEVVSELRGRRDSLERVAAALLTCTTLAGDQVKHLLRAET